MAIFKSVDLSRDGLDAKNPDLLANEIYYFMNPDKMPNRYWGGICFVKTEIPDIVRQFSVPGRLYHKHDYIRAHHFILSFSGKYDAVTPHQAYRIGNEVSELFWPEYQVIFAVHENTDELHIHFLVNPVSLNDGKLLGSGTVNPANLQLQISAILRSPEQWGGCKPVALMGPNW